jgi:hypothetical protein
MFEVFALIELLEKGCHCPESCFYRENHGEAFGCHLGFFTYKGCRMKPNERNKVFLNRLKELGYEPRFNKDGYLKPYQDMMGFLEETEEGEDDTF